MPTPVKAVDNMNKHLTRAEREAREEQEERSMPNRKLKRPTLITKDKAAAKHWTRILKDMKGLDILDALDADALGIYCAKLARRDDLQAFYLEVRTRYEADKENAVLRSMTKLSAELQSIERELLAYASRLGLTPESRARLARKQAEQEEDDPDGDLFA